MKYTIFIWMVMAVVTSSKACEEGSYESVDAGGCVKCKGKCDDQHEEDKASCKKACERTSSSAPTPTSFTPTISSSYQLISTMAPSSKENAKNNLGLVLGLSLGIGLPLVFIVAILAIAYYSRLCSRTVITSPQSVEHEMAMVPQPVPRESSSTPHGDEEVRVNSPVAQEEQNEKHRFVRARQEENENSE